MIDPFLGMSVIVSRDSYCVSGAFYVQLIMTRQRQLVVLGVDNWGGWLVLEDILA